MTLYQWAPHAVTPFSQQQCHLVGLLYHPFSRSVYCKLRRRWYSDLHSLPGGGCKETPHNNFLWITLPPQCCSAFHYRNDSLLPGHEETCGVFSLSLLRHPVRNLPVEKYINLSDGFHLEMYTSRSPVTSLDDTFLLDPAVDGMCRTCFSTRTFSWNHLIVSKRIFWRPAQPCTP